MVKVIVTLMILQVKICKYFLVTSYIKNMIGDFYSAVLTKIANSKVETNLLKLVYLQLGNYDIKINLKDRYTITQKNAVKVLTEDISTIKIYLRSNGNCKSK
ncbi:MAG: hypothetical protein WBA54_06440 [Acidaminobacteraceae bacterium]